MNTNLNMHDRLLADLEFDLIDLIYELDDIIERHNNIVNTLLHEDRLLIEFPKRQTNRDHNEEA